MTTVGPPQPADERQVTGRPYRVVGQSPAHHDFVDKVKGALHYAADWRLPGMLHGRIVRSQLPSARITGIDASAARALPGVVAEAPEKIGAHRSANCAARILRQHEAV